MQRRRFLQQSAGSAVLSLLAGPQLFARQDTPYTLKEVRRGVGIFSEKGGTIAHLATKEGIVVVDSQFPEQSQHLIEQLKKQSDRPFKYLINTHHHGDHTGGNVAYKGLVEHVVAHQNSLKNQTIVAKRNQSEEKQLYPDTTFTDRWQVKVGPERIRAYYFGEGHTNGDSVIHFENANVAHLGDLLFKGRYPAVDRTAGASIKHWVTVLDQVEKTFDKDTIFIFGHAFDPQAVTGDRSEIGTFRGYLEKLLTFVGSEIKAGKSKDDVLKATAIPGVTDVKGDGLSRNLQTAYEELTEA
ncbi:MBL fold metallo-hydrolase [Larkinella soli]|uniref:MBL fold metallo-hydrolase n=1 Tax=Larkinella soli TaxID=1770527 RepID=UPI000FFB1314|nr:MBL fold metallo-hydrolase [Larkinella soli]